MRENTEHAVWTLRLPPQLCGQPTPEQRLAGRLSLSDVEADRLAPWLRAPDFAPAVAAADGTDGELHLALSVLADWYVHEQQGLPAIRLKEADSAASLQSHLVDAVQGDGLSDFMKEQRGTDLRRRFDRALDRASKNDPTLTLDRAMTRLGRLTASRRQKSLDAGGPQSKLDVITLVAPDTVGDVEYFLDEGNSVDRAEDPTSRYRSAWGPFIPDPVWRLMLGTVQFLETSEAETGHSPLSPSIVSANDAQRLYASALNRANLRVAVRWVARVAYGVRRFDTEGWVRSEKSGLDADLGLNLTDISEDALCDWIAELVVTAAQDSETSS